MIRADAEHTGDIGNRGNRCRRSIRRIIRRIRPWRGILIDDREQVEVGRAGWVARLWRVTRHAIAREHGANTAGMERVEHAGRTLADKAGLARGYQRARLHAFAVPRQVARHADEGIRVRPGAVVPLAGAPIAVANVSGVPPS